jgi:hypothetical protein
MRRQRIPLLMPAAGLVAMLALPAQADAAEGEGNKPKRKGGQAEAMVGASACIPGKGECRDEALGSTSPSIGMAFDVGWRAHPGFFVGAGYGVGWFNPTWETVAGREFRTAYNQGVFGVLRGYVPIWRVDIGFELSPGWTRQTFVSKSSNIRTYSQGFALRPGLSVDIWLGRHLFVGAKLDFVFNFHKEMCLKTESMRDCTIGTGEARDIRAHQLIGGVHVGGTF